MDSTRTDVDLLQTEWDVCGRELQAAAERVDTRNRVGAASAELANLNRALDHQDHWLDSSAAAVAQCNDEAVLKSTSGECQVRVELLHLNFITDVPLRLTSCIADSIINNTIFSQGLQLLQGKIGILVI